MSEYDGEQSTFQQSWLKLSLIKSMTWVQKLALIKVYKTPENIFEENPSSIVRNLGPRNQLKSDFLMDYDVDLLNKIAQYLANNPRVKLIGYRDKNYPALLQNIAKPPLLLYACGDASLLNKHCMAIVGSRHASFYGKEIAFDMAGQLVNNEVVVVSGMAAGIDSFAHQGALSALELSKDADKEDGDSASTVAVLGSGINVCYPKSNASLYQAIAKHGLLISEYHPWSTPLPYRFPQRNRIISGLSLGVIVIEASLKSGSLITAKMAMEENRDIFSLPGSIHSVHSKGCHYLIKQGAKLIENVDDILTEYQIKGLLQPLKNKREKVYSEENNLKESLTKDQGNVLNSIEFNPTSLDKVLARSEIESQKVNVILLQLELLGYIKQDETQKYRRVV